MTFKFLTLLFVHLLLDYPLQGQFLGEKKSLTSFFGAYLLLVHSFIWGMGIIWTMHFLSIPWEWTTLGFLVIGHAHMDGWKAYILSRRIKNSDDIVRSLMYGSNYVAGSWLTLEVAFFIDQTWHILQIILVTFFYSAFI